jgi:CheY-like chemotaxis protein
MDGIDFLKVIKSKPDLREIPVIAYGSAVSSKDVRLAYGLGANCVVNKPKDFEELKDLVRLLEEFWLKWVIYHDET